MSGVNSQAEANATVPTNIGSVYRVGFTIVAVKDKASHSFRIGLSPYSAAE